MCLESTIDSCYNLINVHVSILLKSDLPKSIYLPIDQFWPIDQYNETGGNIA